MKKIFKITAIALVSLLAVSCYEDFIKDYEKTATYFASQKPLRTVVADRDMTIEVGAPVGGMRDGWENETASFIIDETILEGTDFELMPAEYYTLSDNSKMKIYKSNVPIMKVTVGFTEAFYQDELSTTAHYALPFRLTGTTLDEILPEKDSTIVVVKYVSTYSGTYYVKGSISQLDPQTWEAIEGTIVKYSNSDLVENFTRTLTTVNRYELTLNGVGNQTAICKGDVMKLTFTDGAISLESSIEGSEILDLESSLGSYTDGQLTINLSYTYKRPSGDDFAYYKISESLVRRQDPVDALIFEEW